ncbi:hypothetical protein [Methylobacterium soli]|uniref:Uncharacterized protein n=1 Tax=Methylobacterium soli TaxID=553447 RepID=A0A6L3T463_9HYPH|nr:hypothetical protein [Methylobacterium soli]KAB1081716.1 hypothetical protein F6X53_01040 [Methylobacterium soli]GJE46194.1 hypothetical protein AEGHOMDF_5394 [Methylobacterium soli]
MTAINAIALGARGRLITDTAAYDRHGVVTAFVNKTVVVPHLGMVFATRGALATRRTLSEELEAFASFDAVIAEGGEVLREAYQAGAFAFAGAWEDNFDLIMVGWSPSRRQAEAYTLSSLSHGGSTPFAFRQLSLILAPDLDDSAMRRIGLKVGRSFDTSRPAHTLLEAIELQRRTPGPVGSGSAAETAYVVGGAAVLTEVSEAGIAQRIVKRWPDEVGRRIEPEGAGPLPQRSPPQLRIVA